MWMEGRRGKQIERSRQYREKHDSSSKTNFREFRPFSAIAENGRNSQKIQCNEISSKNIILQKYNPPKSKQNDHVHNFLHIKTV